MHTNADVKQRRDRVIGYSLGVDFQTMVRASEKCSGKTKQTAVKIVHEMCRELKDSYGLDGYDPESWRKLPLGLVDRYTEKLETLYNTLRQELGDDFHLLIA